MIVLYSALFGGSDTLKPAPAGPDRCVMFTDNAALAGHGWEFIVEPRSAFTRWQARQKKTTSHLLFPDAEIVVWADASMTIMDWPRLIRDFTPGGDVACLPHPFRNNCYDEGAKCIELKIGGVRNITKALDGMRADGFAPTVLSTTGLFLRRNTDAVRRMNEFWYDHLERFGINDQVHLDYCAWKAGASRVWLAGNYLDNPYMVYDRLDHRKHRKPQYLPDPTPSDAERRFRL